MTFDIVVFIENWKSGDAYCEKLILNRITQNDKCTFWEMMRLMHSIPALSQMCSHRIKKPAQIAFMFSLTEYKSLWSAEASNCMSVETVRSLLHLLFCKEE
jgi:hypothetical protein